MRNDPELGVRCEFVKDAWAGWHDKDKSAILNWEYGDWVLRWRH